MFRNSSDNLLNSIFLTFRLFTANMQNIFYFLHEATSSNRNVWFLFDLSIKPLNISSTSTIRSHFFPFRTWCSNDWTATDRSILLRPCSVQVSSQHFSHSTVSRRRIISNNLQLVEQSIAERPKHENIQQSNAQPQKNPIFTRRR